MNKPTMITEIQDAVSEAEHDQEEIKLRSLNLSEKTLQSELKSIRKKKAGTEGYQSDTDAPSIEEISEIIQKLANNGDFTEYTMWNYMPYWHRFAYLDYEFHDWMETLTDYARFLEEDVASLSEIIGIKSDYDSVRTEKVSDLMGFYSEEKIKDRKAFLQSRPDPHVECDHIEADAIRCSKDDNPNNEILERNPGIAAYLIYATVEYITALEKMLTELEDKQLEMILGN